MISKPKLLLLIASFTLMNSAYSQRSMNESLGTLTSFEVNDQHLNILTDNGRVAITAYDAGIIRIRIVKDNFIERFSYAVEAQPVKTNLNVKDENARLLLQTSLLTLEITKDPVRFNFYSYDGSLLNADDPSFGTSWIGTEVTTFKTLQPDERFLGLGEKTGNLDRRGSAYDNWNTDNPRYGPADDPLYVTIPFYIGITGQKAYGIFFDNSHRSRFNFGASNDRFSSFGADDGEMDYYFFHHDNIAGIIKQYTDITGRMSMPPIWSLGYQQCRWSYFPDSEVLNVAREFRSRKIPLDVLYLDIHYMDAYKIFTWHPVRFPNPSKLLNDLNSLGVHTTVIVDPGIKVEKGYEAYEDGVAKNVFAKFPDGELYTAQVWPGWCHFPDFTMPEAREWWGSYFKGLVDLGIDGFWNDMNEIASWGGGYTPHLVNFNWEGENATYRQAKNVYGMLMAKSTFEGTKKLMNGKRPFNLTRAGYAGLQKYTVLWTGDNHATEEHMMLGARLINSLGLSGVSFAGVDVGGFSKDATPSLFARWISLGAFTPFFRSHTHYDTRQSEPWVYGETVENISRNYISFRYKMLPYLYSVFYQSTLDGMPIARSLAIDYTKDEKVFWYVYQHQYMFGPAILVAPVESTKEHAKVYLPAGGWYNLHSGEFFEGNKEIVTESSISHLPLFVKAGSVIPLQNAVQHTGESAGDTLFLHVFKGNEVSNFQYYEDDGTTYEYENGNYYSRNIIFDPMKKEITLEAVSGNFKSRFTKIQVLLHGFNTEQFSINNRSTPTKDSKVNMLNSLEETDPLFLENLHMSIPVKRIEINNDSGRIVVKWK